MRVDKFLKVSRVLKRRTVSKELAKHQRISINGRIVKPAHEVHVGDLITITYGRRQMTIRVLQVNAYSKKEDSVSMYEVVEETWIEEDRKEYRGESISI